MSETLTIKSDALEPLFEAWEEPNRHRVRAASGEGAVVQNRRRPSPINAGMVQNLRAEVKAWRDNYYYGASDTSRQLLNHWFGRSHRMMTGGNEIEFRYYFCQREAIETLIYLKEVRRTERLSQLIAEFDGTQAEAAALGITEEEDALCRSAFKMATGSGNITKVMSLAIVWSYFHALRESESPMARHFVVIAPNLTVFERLKEDFKPEGGGMDIFDKDPLIPVEWRGDWNLTIVLQDDASGAATGAVLYRHHGTRIDPRHHARRFRQTFRHQHPRTLLRPATLRAARGGKGPCRKCGEYPVDGHALRPILPRALFGVESDVPWRTSPKTPPRRCGRIASASTASIAAGWTRQARIWCSASSARRMAGWNRRRGAATDGNAGQARPCRAAGQFHAFPRLGRDDRGLGGFRSERRRGLPGVRREMTIRFGLLGAGRIGKVHAKAVTSDPAAKLVAVADAMPAAAQAIADQYGAEVRSIMLGACWKR